MQTRISLLVPDMPDSEALLPWLRRIDAARWYTNFGPLTRELEEKLAARFGGEAAVLSVSNCTVGLELALQALSLRPGARVLIPALTFVATAASVLRAGLVPVLCDVDPESWLLTPEIAQRALAEHAIDAFMPVVTYGCPQDAAAWDRLAAASGVPVILDAAGAFGNQAAGTRIAAVFSLHATKTLGSGEGGFIVSAQRDFLDAVRRLCNFGIEDNGLVQGAGTNGKLSEYHAAVAHAALERWTARSALRVGLHRRYIGALARTCPDVRLQRRPVDGVYSIMPVLLPRAAEASRVAQQLAERGIQARRWYCPTLDRHPAFSALPHAGPLEVAAQLSERLLALPFHPFLSESEVETVCTELARALAR